MNNREEFEKWRSLQKGEEYNELEYLAWLTVTIQKQKIIDELKAENPDVPCPAGCDGDGYISSGIGPVVCTFCSGKGTVSTVKALQHEIEQLKKVNKLLQESLDDDLIKTLKAMEDKHGN